MAGTPWVGKTDHADVPSKLDAVEDLLGVPVPGEGQPPFIEVQRGVLNGDFCAILVCAPGGEDFADNVELLLPYGVLRISGGVYTIIMAENPAANWVGVRFLYSGRDFVTAASSIMCGQYTCDRTSSTEVLCSHDRTFLFTPSALSLADSSGPTLAPQNVNASRLILPDGFGTRIGAKGSRPKIPGF